MKKISYLLIFLLLSSCGYKSVYNEKSFNTLSIKNYSLDGDKNVNRKLLSLLDFKKNNFSSYELSLISKKSRQISSKNALGNPLTYKMTLVLNFTIKNLDTDEIFKTKKFTNSSSYNIIENNFDFSRYEKEIEENLILKIHEEILIYLNL
tara:strand:+ start:777 stop:1226 length:450 start_codon:yes stop_codon:yes gene_type:complete